MVFLAGFGFGGLKFLECGVLGALGFSIEGLVFNIVVIVKIVVIIKIKIKIKLIIIIIV